MQAAQRHLRVLGTDPDPRVNETEAMVLAGVAAALTYAVNHPALSTGWRVAFQAALQHLSSFVGPLLG